MGKNLVTRQLTGAGTFTVPAGVNKLTITPVTFPIPLASGPTSAITLGAYCWGAGVLLGNNSFTNVSSPVGTGFSLPFKTLLFSADMSIGLTPDGTPYAWGSNANGQLGNNAVSAQTAPGPVYGGLKFISVAVPVQVANRGTLGLTSLIGGTTYGWGINTKGNLGDGTTNSRSTPTAVIGGHTFKYIANGGDTCHAIRTDDVTFSWGDNSVGQLGNNTITNASSPVSIVGGHVFTSIISGGISGLNTAAIKADGSVWCWGQSTAGGLGNNANSNTSSPVSVVGGHLFAQILVYPNTIVARKSDGSVWGWGSNANGTLGDGTTNSRSSPVSVIGGHLFTNIVVCVAGGGWLGIKSGGSVWGCGANSSGALGDGTNSNRSSPVSVIGGHVFSAIYEGIKGLRTDGMIMAWGTNAIGQIGDGTTTAKSSPVAISAAPLLSSAVLLQGVAIGYPNVVSVTPGESILYSVTASYFKTLTLPVGADALVVQYQG